MPNPLDMCRVMCGTRCCVLNRLRTGARFSHIIAPDRYCPAGTGGGGRVVIAHGFGPAEVAGGGGRVVIPEKGSSDAEVAMGYGDVGITTNGRGVTETRCAAVLDDQGAVDVDTDLWFVNVESAVTVRVVLTRITLN